MNGGQVGLAGDGDQRSVVKEGVGHAGDKVCGPGAQRGKANAGLAGEPAEDVGHQGGALLVPSGYEADAALGERIKQGERLLARNAEYLGHAFVYKAFVMLCGVTNSWFCVI